jgi:dephospho-CoA kinase
MRTSSFIITLTGSSGCGKTYITDRIIDFDAPLSSAISLTGILKLTAHTE